jgi:hypothetical protein
MSSSNGQIEKHQLFREVNRRIREVCDSFESGGTAEFLCECDQQDCQEILELTEAQYDGLLDDSNRILLAIRHKDSLNGDRVLVEYDRFLVVAHGNNAHSA